MANRRRARPVIRLPIWRCRRARGNARRVLSAFVKLRREGGNGKPREEVFDASRVDRMLRSGQLGDAHYYLVRFLGRVPEKDSSPVSWQLLDQVGLFKILSTVAAGGKDGAALAALYLDPSEFPPNWPLAARLRKLIAKMNADPIRASKIWQEIQPEQLDRIMDLVYRCPELQGDVRLPLPRKRTLPWEPTTHGLCKCPSLRRKITKHTPSHVLVREFLRTRLLMTQGVNGSEQPMDHLERAPEKQEVTQV